MDDDLHLLHMAINMDINLLTCEQINLCSMLKLIQNYDFLARYSVEGILEASNVFKCVDKQTYQEYVLKLIPMNEFENFIKIYLHTSDNSSINRVVNIVHEKEYVFILFESAFDDLHSYLKRQGKLSENEIHSLFYQIVQIVHKLHQRGVALNDLKLRKFVFTDLNRKMLKLENLDAASLIDDENVTNDRKHYGCILYQAPEMLCDEIDYLMKYKQSGEENFRADLWSLGVILYTLTFAKYPFHHSNLDILRNQILNSTYELPQIHLSLHPLVTSLLSKDPMSRPTTGELLENEWLVSMKFIDQRQGKLNSNHTDGKPGHQFSVYHVDQSTLNLSAKEYYSKLSKLIKCISLSIKQKVNYCTTTKTTQFQLENLESKVNDVPVVYYFESRLSFNQTGEQKISFKSSKEH